MPFTGIYGRPGNATRLLCFMNATFIFIIFAYFHHLYMDCTTGSFHMPTDNILLSAIPATAVTYAGHCPALSFKVKWGPFRVHSWRCAGWAMAFCSGCDSTIPANTVFHNTTWVPDTSIHMLMGVCIFYFWISVLFFAHKAELIKTCWRGWASGYLLFSGHIFLATIYREGCGVSQEDIQIMQVSLCNTFMRQGNGLPLCLLSLLVFF